MAISQDLLGSAEVSNGGVGGMDTNLEVSLLRVRLEDLRAQLRRSQHILEEKKRELEYLLKGGNPLEYLNYRQGTSLKEQHP